MDIAKAKVKKQSCNAQSIALIYVLFNPSHKDIEYVERMSQNYRGYVVDNSHTANFDKSVVNNMAYIFLGTNKGIGYAQNVALKAVMESTDFKYVVFFDQDTRVDIGYPLSIVNEYCDFCNDNNNLAFLGPTVINNANGIAYQSIFHKDRLNGSGMILRREIISSGSCIAIDILAKIGLSEEQLFLDFVDCEWCWRAESLGYVCGITPNLCISHKVGSEDLYIGKYEIIISAPFRYFYQCRNFVWLCQRKYVPTQWKFANGVKIFCRLFYFPFVVNQGSKCVKYAIKGLFTGLTVKNNK